MFSSLFSFWCAMLLFGERVPPDVLRGIAKQVVYHNPENFYTVLRLQSEDFVAPVTVVGNLLSVQQGEELLLRGEWIEDSRYGRQFKVESYERNQPSTLKGIRIYLGSMVKGIGPKLAERIVKYFGLETLRVIQQEPERLSEVKGFGKSRIKQVLDSWREHQEKQEVMVYLQGLGITTHQSLKIYRQYGSHTLQVLQTEPYRIAKDIRGIGFRKADEIALLAGISEDSPERAQAALLYHLDRASEEGHVYLPWKELAKKTYDDCSISIELLEQALMTLEEASEIVVEALEGEELAIYRRVLAACERGTATWCRKIKDQNVGGLDLETEKTLDRFEKQSHLSLAESQRKAVTMAVQSPFSIITGGPGTGKTTIVRAVCMCLKEQGAWITLAAPTGRAAKRMQEATGFEAKTLHRLLEFSPQSYSFLRNQDRPLKTDYLIIDEASMIDTYLFYHLLRALPPGAQLLLVGDVDQLPSVGPGMILKELLTSGEIEFTRLDKIFRQKEGAFIVKSAHQINLGLVPVIEAPSSKEELQDLYFIKKKEPVQIAETIVSLVTKHIPRRFGFDTLKDIQVISPMHRGDVGVQALNQRLQKALNLNKQALFSGSSSFFVGDRVLQTRNDYDKDVFNGDVGIISSIDHEARSLEVSFEGRLIEYEPSELDDLILAYAISVHKSQGSEYPAVVIPLCGQHYMMLQRNLLYTALTRGKQLVILVGQPSALKRAVQNNQISQRFTRLAWRLQQ